VTQTLTITKASLSTQKKFTRNLDTRLSQSYKCNRCGRRSGAILQPCKRSALVWASSYSLQQLRVDEPGFLTAPRALRVHWEGNQMSDNQRPELSTEPASDFQDRSISCIDCGEQFVWSIGEQVFFTDKGLRNEPKRCKPCKQAKTQRLAAISLARDSGIRQRIEVTVTCAQCGQQTTVPFYPSQGRPVYCRSCFLAARTMSATA